MIIMGIDPGQTGGIGVISDSIVIAYPMPVIVLKKGKEISGWAISGLITKYKPDLVLIESVHAMPKQGVTSTFNFGKGFGKILGVCEALNCTYETISPNVWKKAVGVTGDKTTSILRCKQMYPKVSLAPTHRSTKDSDGMAEALLIASYGRYKSREKGGDIFQ